MSQAVGVRSANGSGSRRGRNDRERESGDWRRDREGSGAWSDSVRSHPQRNPQGSGPGAVQPGPSSRGASSDRSDRQSAERPLHDKLVLMTMCLIGQTVEVHTRTGLVYQGIFHAANSENDFGVILKMARLLRDSKSNKADAAKESVRKPPIKTLVINAKDFVQIVAKDVPLSLDSPINGDAREVDVITDKELSRRRSSIEERELTPWRPDEGEEGGAQLRLDATFSSWNNHGRSSWDQFAANRELFGVETTFREEIYTTKLEKGADPISRQREREAERIAREIERSDTRNVHLMEERGQRLAPEIDALDEEQRYSSVLRSAGLDAGQGEDEHDRNIDTCNDETFGEAELAGPSSKEAGTGGEKEGEAAAKQKKSGDGVSAAVAAPPKRDDGPRRTVSADKAGSSGLGAMAAQAPAEEGDKEGQKEALRLKLPLDSKAKRLTKGGLGSPFNSPVARRSPLISPLAGDPTIQHLNLDPSCPKIPDAVYREFYEFKKVATASIANDRRAADVEDLRHFAQTFRTKKDSEPRSPSDAAKPGPLPSAASAPPSLEKAPLAQDKAKPTPKPSATITTRPTSSSGGAKSPPGAKKSPAAVIVVPGVSGPSLGSSPTGEGKSKEGVETAAPSTSQGTPAAPAVKSKLNPNAKEFKLNPNAAVFSPAPPAPRAMVPVMPVQQMPPQIYLPGGMQGAPMAIGPGGQFVPAQQFNQYAAMQASMGYAMPPGTFVPGGVPPGMPAGQPGVKMQPQQQVVPGPFAQQGVRFPPQGMPMQGGPYMYPGGQQYPQGVIYGPQGQMMYMPMVQPMPMPQQMASPPQQQQGQPKMRGGSPQQGPMRFGQGGYMTIPPLPTVPPQFGHQAAQPPSPGAGPGSASNQSLPSAASPAKPAG